LAQTQLMSRLGSGQGHRLGRMTIEGDRR